MMLPPFRTARRRCRAIGGQFEIAGEIDLDAVPLANRDGRKPVQKPVHDLHGRLRRRIAHAAGDDHRAVAVAASRPAVPTNCASPLIRPTAAAAPNVDQVVVVHPVPQAGVADLVQAHELVERDTCGRRA